MKTNTNPIKYVVGFMFDEPKKRVSLIRKQKPYWQRGKLNGIGGKRGDAIDIKDETSRAAMVREFREETGLITTQSQWRHFCTMTGGNNDGDGSFSIDFYVTVGDLLALKTQEVEEIKIEYVSKIFITRCDCVENLPWLVGMALDHIQDGRPSFAIVTYP